jgi:urease accessory protein
MNRRLATVALIATLAVPIAASAHTGRHDTSGFLHGLLHPLGGADHLLAMIAVGLLAALSGGHARWLLPLAFPAVMAAGAIAGIAGTEITGMEAMIAVSTVAIAGLAAWGVRLQLAVLVPFVGFFAFFHGLAHGLEMPADASGLAYGLGFVLATASLHAVGLLGGGLLLARDGGARFARGCAAALAAAGLLPLAGLF